MSERYTYEEAWYELGGRNILTMHTMEVVSRALARMPKDIADWALKAIRFISIGKEERGGMKRMDELEGCKYVIILSLDWLEEATEEEQLFTVCHEIAHAKLDHKGLSDTQEKEADRLAEKWLGYARPARL